MAQIRVAHDEFTLTSTWHNSADSGSSAPSTATRKITFEYSVPANTEVKSAKVHTSWSSPLGGFAVRTVNGKTPDDDGFVTVEIDPEGSSISMTVAFKSYGTTDEGNHSGKTKVSEVYLLIEYAYQSCIFRAEDGVLVPYNFYRVEEGALVMYRFFGIPGDSSAQQLYTADGKLYRTTDSENFKVLGE